MAEGRTCVAGKGAETGLGVGRGAKSFWFRQGWRRLHHGVTGFEVEAPLSTDPWLALGLFVGDVEVSGVLCLALAFWCVVNPQEAVMAARTRNFDLGFIGVLCVISVPRHSWAVHALPPYSSGHAIGFVALKTLILKGNRCVWKWGRGGGAVGVTDSERGGAMRSGLLSVNSK